MFTFASTLTAIGIGSGFSSMSCAVYGAPCNPCFDDDSGTVNGGGSDSAAPYDAAFPIDAASPDASDAAFIDDTNDAGDDAD